MIRRDFRNLRANQRGWMGMIVMLVALVIVAFLAKDALKEYGFGMLGGTDAPAGARPKGERMPTAGAVSGVLDMNSAPSAPATPIERARGVESSLQQQADERARRVDDATK